MPVPTNTPFTPDHGEIIRQGCRACQETQAMLERFQRAGLNVDQQLAENGQHRAIFEGLKREFFPDGTAAANH